VENLIGVLYMKRGEAVFFVGAILFVISLRTPGDVSSLAGYSSYIFMLTGLAMWWVDRKKSLKKYMDQRVKAEVKRQLRERKEEQERT